MKTRLVREHDPVRRRLLLGIGATLLPWTARVSANPVRSATVATTHGRVQGIEQGAVSTFRGIPYGADTATTRFRRPKPAPAWTGVRETVDYAACCPQTERGVRGPRKLLSSWLIPQRQSEDCLYLNIWTPRTGDTVQRPVMVWLHGGGFANGSGAASVYEGNRLVERGDVVLVTLNHRLNVFGYLCLAEMSGEFADSGNAGQHDIVLALQWIRDNIAQFGGDPDNITLFGESGGGAKISTLLAMEEASGLFHRAVIQSGPMLWAADMASATETGRMGLEVLGASRTRLKRLDSASTQQLLAMLGEIKARGRFRTLAPVVDDRGLTRHPFVPDAPAVSRDIPVMVGHTATESTFLLGFDDSLFELDWAALPDRLAETISGVDTSAIVAQYRDAFPDYSASDVYFDVTTMYLIVRNAIRIADLRNEQHAAPVFFYELGFRLGLDGGKWRSPHTLDIPLVFDNIDKSASMFADPTNAQPLADRMSEAWLAFARHGRPVARGLPDWPAWGQEQQTMLFDTDSRVVMAPRRRKAGILRDMPYWDLTKPNDL